MKNSTPTKLLVCLWVCSLMLIGCVASTPQTTPPPQEPVQVKDKQSSAIFSEIGIGQANVGGYEYRPGGTRWIGIGIGNIKPGSIAQEAGLKNGDIILTIDGVTTLPIVTLIYPEHHLAKLLNKKSTLKLVVRRFQKFHPIMYEGMEVWQPLIPEDIEIEINLA